MPAIIVHVEERQAVQSCYLQLNGTYAPDILSVSNVHFIASLGIFAQSMFLLPLFVPFNSLFVSLTLALIFAICDSPNCLINDFVFPYWLFPDIFPANRASLLP
jgi:hypothetical protein